ncbi:hypothetical protein [Actinomadura sp. 21ATH]|uniref:hypothetical protein n=1 Tax=Actinomadura sp. 21ATH TaxID=1735444 RepID=UPI0035BF8413
MRCFDPAAYQQSSPAIRIPASYVTQHGLVAVLRRTIADDIERLNPELASQLRHGAMPADDTRERWHHLRMLRELVDEIAMEGQRRAKVAALRRRYEAAQHQFNELTGQVRLMGRSDREMWIDAPYRALQQYAEAENLW